jgi:molybdopterin-synthase adenylyltransferase
MSSFTESQGRYARLEAIPSFQLDGLRNAHIMQVGAGAVGNELAKNLVLSGLGHLTIVDKDTVALHNLTRSAFLRESDLGESKVKVLSTRLRELNPDSTIRGIHADIQDVLGASDLKGVAACIAAVDNLEARLYLNSICHRSGIYFLQAGVSATQVMVEAFPFHNPGFNSACYACSLPSSAFEKMAQRYACAGLLKQGQEGPVIPTTVMTAAHAGAQLCQWALQRFYKQEASQAANEQSRRWFLDLVTGGAQTHQLRKRDLCPYCCDLRPVPVVETYWEQGFSPKAILHLMNRQSYAGLRLCEPILTGCSCLQCGQSGFSSQVLGRPTRHFDAGLTWCPECQSHSRSIDSRDVLTPDFLISFRHPIAVQYAVFVDEQGADQALLTATQRPHQNFS